MNRSRTSNPFAILRAVFTLAVCSAALGGCGTHVGMAAGAGATVGIAAASEGGFQRATTDARIRIQIHDLWFKHNVDMYTMLDMTVREGRVLVTGTVPDPDMRVDAIRLAWQPDGVRQVINEINVDEGDGIPGYVRDSWITGNVKTKMVFDKHIQSINYSIDTVKSTVYLMGIAQNEDELQRVLDHARFTPKVENVVSYVRLRGETPPGVLDPTGG